MYPSPLTQLAQHRHASTSSVPEATHASDAHGSQKTVVADAQTLLALYQLFKLVSVCHLPLTTSSSAVDAARTTKIFCCPFSPFCCCAMQTACAATTAALILGAYHKCCASQAFALSVTLCFCFCFCICFCMCFIFAEAKRAACSCAQKAREAADLWRSHRTRPAANLTMKLGIWL